MSFPPAPKETPLDNVIPDCCNIGVIFRTLLLVNGAVLLATLTRTKGTVAGLLDFVESSMLIEWVCLLSLLMLCAVRRGLVRSGAIRTVSLWSQRALCAVIPALITLSMLYLLSSFDWFLASFSHLSKLEGTLLACLFGLVLQHYFELRMRAFSPALSEARLQALQARIRPHFLFNSLNAVLSLIRTEPQRAEATLEDLADLFRVLMQDTRAMTTLEKEIFLCKQYLSIEKIRLGERLQVTWDTGNMSDEMLQKTQISSLMLQPLLENAVRYGIEPSRTPALITIRIGRTLDRMEIVVLNPQHADAPVMAGNQMALNNIRERLTLLYDVEAQLSSGIVQGQFEVRLRFPYIKA